MKTIFGTHDANTLAQFEDISSRAVHAALMSDGHLGYVMPIGGVAAYRNQVRDTQGEAARKNRKDRTDD